MPAYPVCCQFAPHDVFPNCKWGKALILLPEVGEFGDRWRKSTPFEGPHRKSAVACAALATNRIGKERTSIFGGMDLLAVLKPRLGLSLNQRGKESCSGTQNTSHHQCSI